MCLCFPGMRQVIFIAARSVVRPALGSVGFPFDCLALVSACLLGVLFVRQSVCRLCDLLASAIPLFARPLGRSRPHLRSQIAAWSPNRSGGHTAGASWVFRARAPVLPLAPVSVRRAAAPGPLKLLW